MCPKLWTKLRGFIQNQREHWELPRLKVEPQFETVRKQSLHHEAHLVLGRIARRSALDVPSIDIDPRHLRLECATLFGRKLVREHHVFKQWEIRCGEQPSCRSVEVLRI